MFLSTSLLAFILYFILFNIFLLFRLSHRTSVYIDHGMLLYIHSAEDEVEL